MTRFTSTRQVATPVTKLSPAFWRQAWAPTVTMTAASSAVYPARLGAAERDRQYAANKVAL
jgi:hypothetical protein